MFLPHLLRLHLPRQHPSPKRQRRHIQQQRRLLQRQPLLGLNRANFNISNKRFRLPLNHRFSNRPTNRLLPLFNLIKPLCTSARTRLYSSLPRNTLPLAIRINLDYTHNSSQEALACVVSPEKPHHTVYYCIIPYHTVSISSAHILKVP